MAVTGPKIVAIHATILGPVWLQTALKNSMLSWEPPSDDAQHP